MMMRSLMRTPMKSRVSTLACRHFDPKDQMPYEDQRITCLSRYNDEPEPHNDEQIVIHYLKHHPMYEFRNLQEMHVDSYRHWLHGRADYYNKETSPAQISPWEQGKKWHHFFFASCPLLFMVFFGRAYLEHLKQKNVKMPVVGVFSQNSI